MLKRKLLRYSAIADAALTYDFLQMMNGKAVKGTVLIEPVSFASDDKGDVKELPTGRQFLLTYIEKFPRFKLRHVAEQGIDLGLHRATVNSAVYVLRNEGILKQTGPGEYAVAASKSALAKAALVTKGQPSPPTQRGGGTSGEPTVATRILTLIRNTQNGDGTGVSLATIKKGFSKESGISPVISDMLKKKLVVRIGKGQYRVAGE